MRTMQTISGCFAIGMSNSPAQNLITNGSFESVVPFTTGSLGVGSTNLMGWNIGGTGTIFVAEVWLPAADGNRFLSLNHNTVTVSQTFNTIPVQDYEVAFSVGYYQGNANMAITAGAFDGSGTLLGTISVNASNVVGWRPSARLRFTAISDLSRVQFSGTNCTPNIDLLLDAVSVEPVVQHVSIVDSPLRLCWESKTNRAYQIQYRTTLTTNSWTDLDSPIDGTGSTICSTQSITEPQRFFRVVTLP